MEAGEKYLDCQDRQLTSVMQEWPKDIHHLLLARNKIQVRHAKIVCYLTRKPSRHLCSVDFLIKQGFSAVCTDF